MIAMFFAIDQALLDLNCSSYGLYCSEAAKEKICTISYFFCRFSCVVKGIRRYRRQGETTLYIKVLPGGRHIGGDGVKYLKIGKEKDGFSKAEKPKRCYNDLNQREDR